MLTFIPLSSQAANFQVGTTLPILIKGKDPSGVRGVRANVWYTPQAFVWPKFKVYFTLGYGHWWANGARTYKQINIISAAPVLRFYFKKSQYFSPFIEASIGPSYLSKTQFATQKLGIHYAFQDEIGLGTGVGKKRKLYFTLSALHYSNGSMAKMNAGITVPLVLNIGYKFDV